MLRNTTASWGTVQQTLHWLIVALVVAQLLVGMTFADLSPDDPLHQSLFPVHTTIGVSILIIMSVRLLWRIVNPVPALPDGLSSGQKTLAHATHWLFYLILIGMPLGGYMMVNAMGHPVPFFGFELPQIIPKNEHLASGLKTFHSLGAAILTVLIALHIAGALRHRYMLKDGVLKRMAPFWK